MKSAGQMRKFYLFFASFPAVGLVLLTLELNGVAGKNANFSTFLVLFGLGLALSGFVLGILTVKCPKCKTRLLWKAVKEQPSQGWFGWLMSLERCPVCKNSRP
jgi:hypothetical protein